MVNLVKHVSKCALSGKNFRVQKAFMEEHYSKDNRYIILKEEYHKVKANFPGHRIIEVKGDVIVVELEKKEQEFDNIMDSTNSIELVQNVYESIIKPSVSPKKEKLDKRSKPDIMSEPSNDISDYKE